LLPVDLDLDVYQGPFDLLLSLVLSEEIDLMEVPLSEVIVAYLERSEEVNQGQDWEDLSEFLVLMSLLLEVKSRLLLPDSQLGAEEEELTPEQAREELVARLARYGQFQAAARRLRELAVGAAPALLRPPAGEVKRRLPPLDEIVGTGDLLELRQCLSRVLERRAEPDDSHLADIKVQLQRQMRTIRKILSRRTRFSFNRVFGGERPLVQALSVFALLELLARGEVRVSQAEPFGDIVVRARQVLKSA